VAEPHHNTYISAYTHTHTHYGHVAAPSSYIYSCDNSLHTPHKKGCSPVWEDQMPLQVNCLYESFQTLTPQKGHAPIMSAHMLLHGSPNCETLLICITRKRTLSYISLLVPCQVMFVTKWLLTQITRKRTLATVSASMPCQVMFVAKWFLTQITSKRTLATVSAHMTLQDPVLVERFLTCITHKRTLTTMTA
jgi:hypothetical protein